MGGGTRGSGEGMMERVESSAFRGWGAKVGNWSEEQTGHVVAGLGYTVRVESCLP